MQTINEIYSYHNGSPLVSDPMVGGVQGVSPHPTKNAVFATCGEDKQLCIWDASTRQRRAVGRLQEMATTLSWSPDAQHIAVSTTLSVSCLQSILVATFFSWLIMSPQVGFVGGYFGVYDASTLLRVAWHRRTSGDIEVVRYSPNGRQVCTGSRENVIDLFDVKNKTSPYHHRKRLTGHSGTVTKLDWSCDSLVLQSNCKAFEILYWNAVKGISLRSTKDTTESDTVSLKNSAFLCTLLCSYLKTLHLYFTCT